MSFFDDLKKSLEAFSKSSESMFQKSSDAVELRKLKMDMPKTAEELTETLRAFRQQDGNGNLQMDEIPLTFIGMWELRFLGHAFGIVDNDYYVSVSDGKVVSSLKT